MKKTIAKIMAAAMVFTSLAGSSVLAAGTTTSALTIFAPGYFTKDAALYLDGEKVFDGSYTARSYGLYDDTAFSTTDDTAYSFFFTDTEMNYLERGVNPDYGANYVPTSVAMTFDAATKPTEDNYLLGWTDAVTPATAPANVVNYTTDDEDIIGGILNSSTDKTSYVTTNHGTVTYEDDVVNAFKSRNVVEWNIRWVAGRGWVGAPQFDFTDSSASEILRQMDAGNAILAPMAVTITAGNWTFETNWTRYTWLWNKYYDASNGYDDEYWNAIVKLKADRNRYTPIRVHVDVVSGSLDGTTGLYVSVVGGTKVYAVKNNVIGTKEIVTKQWASNRLQVMDVQSDDLAILRSDVAKGKNLMLDEAFLFRVDGVWNNNSLAGAGDAIYDFSSLGQNTDLGTISIGKIQDIRSRLFKDCKEKLVHAKNVKWIRNGAFRKNKQLKKAILSDDVSMKKINEKAFYDCKRLNTVKVKVNTLKHVGKSAFGGSTDKKGLKFNLKAGSKAKFNKAVKLFKKSGVKKAHFKKI